MQRARPFWRLPCTLAPSASPLAWVPPPFAPAGHPPLAPLLVPGIHPLPSEARVSVAMPQGCKPATPSSGLGRKREAVFGGGGYETV